MISQGLFSIGGIASGLDTEGIVDQLLKLERQPVTRLQNTQAALRKVDDMWVQVQARLSGLRSAADRLADPTRFSKLVKTTSSQPDAVAVTAGGSGTGSLSFTVDRLASAHQVASGTVPSATDPLGAGSVTIQVGSGEAVTFDLDETTTLSQLATKINGSGAGVRASVVKAGDGDHRLVVEATASGDANQISVVSNLDAFSNVTELRAGQDAVLSVGSLEIRRPSNTVTDLVPGASITLRSTTTSPVTVTSAQDVDGAVAAVKEYVDGLNNAISFLAKETRYNPETEAAGVLQGDPAARRLLDQLRSIATAPVGAELGGINHAHDIGISVDRRGDVTLDETKLRAALAQDFEGVGRLLSRTGTGSNEAATSVAGNTSTAAGTYELSVTRAAQVARITGASYTPPGPGEPKTFRISAAGKTVTVTLNATDHSTPEAAAAAIQAALDAAKITAVAAEVDGDALSLVGARYGSGATFTVEGLDGEEVDPDATVFGLAGTHAGVDVEGILDGHLVTGSGRTLTGTTGPTTGLSVTWNGEPGDSTVTFSRGLAGGLGTMLRTTQGSSGTVARARDGIASQIKLHQQRIDGFETRIASREVTLRRQFVAMETALGQMNSQMQWLTSQIAGLPGNGPAR